MPLARHFIRLCLNYLDDEGEVSPETDEAQSKLVKRSNEYDEPFLFDKRWFNYKPRRSRKNCARSRATASSVCLASESKTVNPLMVFPRSSLTKARLTSDVR